MSSTNTPDTAANTDAGSRTTMDRFEAKCLASVHCMIGFMTASRKDEEYKARHIKALFNHAGRALPADLANAKDDDKYSLPKAEKAKLLYQSARKAGDGVIRSASLWLRARV